MMDHAGDRWRGHRARPANKTGRATCCLVEWTHSHSRTFDTEVQFRDPILASSFTPRIANPPGSFPPPEGTLQCWQPLRVTFCSH